MYGSGRIQVMLKITKVKKCKTCDVKLPEGTETAEIRYNSADGVNVMEVCIACANLFDKISDALLDRHKNNYEGFDE